MPRPAMDAPSENERDRRDYPILDQLDRLEELLEEMDELGISSRAEVERRIAELEARLDDVSPES